jgi:citrate synthase
VPSLALVDAAVEAGTVSGEIIAIARQIQAHISQKSGRHVTMNVDGTGAIILGELGFAPMLGRGLFVLSRSVGILSHAWEQHNQGGRNKGPIPKGFLYTYSGVPQRDVPVDRE